MNKRLLLLALAVGFVIRANAETAVISSRQEKLSVIERKAKFEQLVNRRVGGFLKRPGSGKGSIAYVNCQKRAPKAWIEESIAYLAEVTKFAIKYHEGTFDLANPSFDGNVALFIIDDDTLPVLLVAPENRWACVNVASVARDMRPAFFEARTKKELSRAFAYHCGATDSRFERSLSRSITAQDELDKNPDYELPMDIVQRFFGYMRPLGVIPVQRATYLKACQEGWAPAPTNVHQRVIWEKVRSEKERGPAKGLKISP